MKIKIKYFDSECQINDLKKGDWFDLRSRKDYHGNKGEFTLIPLGVAMMLPEGFEAVVAPRSSSFMNYKFIMTNSIGVIDNSYCGNNDEWKCPAYFLESGDIKKGDRICQFRIQPSQKAPFYVKLKWLFSSKIKFKKVEQLEAADRDGFGSSGKQ